MTVQTVESVPLKVSYGEGGIHKCTGQEPVFVLSCMSIISTGKARLRLLIQKKNLHLKCVSSSVLNTEGKNGL